MDQYKLLNAELMGQVQSQRLIISKMQQSEIVLKRQWMEEHERRLEEENKIKNAVKTMLTSLGLNLDININPSDGIPENKKCGRRSSSALCSEFRRSSSLLPKTMSTSPTRQDRSRNSLEIRNSDSSTRRRSVKVAIEVTKTPEPCRIVELQERLISSSEESEESDHHSENEHVETVPPSESEQRGMFSIIEESESEDVTLSSSIEVDSTSTSSPISVSNSNMEISKLPLRDITNTTDMLISNSLSIKVNRSSSELSPSDSERQASRMKQNSPGKPKQTYSSSSSRITIRRGPSERTHKKKSLNNSQDHTIQNVRHARGQHSPMRLTGSCPSINLATNLTPRQSHLTFNSFKNIIGRPEDCSTPRAEQSKHKASTLTLEFKRKTTARSGDWCCEEPSTLAGRPQRRCRPKSLKEPNLNTKLRNEASSKSLHRIS